jgi:hypothetical protein
MALHKLHTRQSEASCGEVISRRECSKCGKLKPLVAFATFRQRNGSVGRRGICRKCRDQYAKDNFEKLQKWRKKYNGSRKNRTKKQRNDARRRAEGRAYVDSFKDKPCADCGRRFPSVAMDLDHVRGSKNRNVASLVGSAYRLELIVAELKKCEVVCACCHRVRTARRKSNLAPTLLQMNRKLTGS